MNNNGNIEVIYFDLMKAFDKVPHLSLISKLIAYGIDMNTTNWVKSFLSNRRQRVVVKEERSDWQNVTSGVPQGSILGPLLFIMYINDLPLTTDSQIVLFADDTKLFNRIDNIEDQEMIQHDINNMVLWSNKWKLKFHPGKCKAMRIGKQDKDPFIYRLENSNLEYIEEEVDLGVTIDSKLNFEAHIISKVNKANKIMGIIRRTFTFLDRTIFTRLFKALVRPHIEYANAVWNANLKKKKKSN